MTFSSPSRLEEFTEGGTVERADAREKKIENKQGVRWRWSARVAGWGRKFASCHQAGELTVFAGLGRAVENPSASDLQFLTSFRKVHFLEVSIATCLYHLTLTRSRPSVSHQIFNLSSMPIVSIKSSTSPPIYERH
jgi:hypothetical protein